MRGLGGYPFAERRSSNELTVTGVGNFSSERLSDAPEAKTRAVNQ
jgi:hypothetical protein